jgi:hypothetical protein
MARLPQPGGDDGTWGDILNDFLSQSHNPDGTLQSAAVPDGSVTPAKLSQSYIPASEKGAANGVATLDATGVVPASQLPPSGSTPDATTISKGIVQLAGDLAGTAAAPTVPGLASKEPTVAAGTASQYYRGDKSWQTLDKAAVGLANVDNTSDANKPVSTATQTALDAKADETITVSGGTSLTGGGDLTANQTLTLVNDAATPGNSRYYGTDGAGTKGFHALPAGDPTMGGDLTGTASNAQIAAGAVGATELASSSVTEPKLDTANSPNNGQVLSWNGTNFTWVDQTVVSGYIQGSGIAKITVGTTAPSSPAIGDLWVNT